MYSVWHVVNGVIQDQGDNRSIWYRTSQEFADNMSNYVGDEWIVVTTWGTYLRIVTLPHLGHTTVNSSPLPWASDEEPQYNYIWAEEGRDPYTGEF